MTDKEKYDFIDHVVHLTIFVEDRLLDEHGGEYSGLEEDGIDSNEYYRIIIERVINILKKNNNYMQEEPVSIWHDKGEEPDEDRQVLINLSGYCYVDFYHKEDKRFYMFGNPKHYLCEVDRWAYIDDILKLSNVQRTTKNWKEPVSEELEEAMQHNAPDNIGIDDLLYWRNGFITGAQWQKTKDSIVSDDLEEAAKLYVSDSLCITGEEDWDDVAIEELNAYKAGAQWQKQQGQSTIELAEDHAMLAGMEKMKEEIMANGVDGVVHHFGKREVASVHYNDPTGVPMAYFISSEGLSAGDKVKIIVIKEG